MEKLKSLKQKNTERKKFNIECNKYLTAKGCPLGVRCRFKHEALDQKVCYKFEETGQCKYGDKCKFVHLKKPDFSCGICMDELDKGYEYSIEACQHKFCLICMEQYFKDKIAGKQTRNIQCPDPTCKSLIHQNQIVMLLDEEYS